MNDLANHNTAVETDARRERIATSAAPQRGRDRARMSQRARLDALLGRLSMYRLVLLALAVLVGWAFVLAALGALAYGPVELAAALTVLVVVTVGSNQLYGRLFGVRPHPESSLITAGLLFFLLWPSTDPLALAGLALAAAAASASKYLVAWGGRHLANPVAVGVLFVTVLQVTGGVWWVATPGMLPVVAVLAVIIWYRTGTSAIGLAFSATAGVLIVAGRVATGNTVLDAITYALVSTPMVFFAAFMLTEPLTLAPRRAQRLVIAAAIGVLFALPNLTTVEAAGIALTPEVALILGNVVSFFLSQRRGLALTLRERRHVGANAVEFTFDATRPVRSRPGQYLELTVPHPRADSRGTRRVFSLVSRSGDAASTVRIATPLPEGMSSFKQALHALEVGSSISATRVAGDFTLPPASRPVALIAGGIGITPFIGQLGHDAAAARADTVVVYAVADLLDVAYRDALVASGARVVLISDRPPSRNFVLPAGWTVVRGRLTEQTLLDAVPDIAERAAYCAGSSAFVSSTGAALRRLGAPKVTVDAFNG